MKRKDAEYYAERIEVFTSQKAKAHNGELKVIFDNGKIVKTRDEEKANELYRECSNIRTKY